MQDLVRALLAIWNEATNRDCKTLPAQIFMITMMKNKKMNRNKMLDFFGLIGLLKNWAGAQNYYSLTFI